MATPKRNYSPDGPLDGISSIDDPRYEVIVHYTLPEIMFLLLAGSVSFCNSLSEIATFGEEKLDWLRAYFPYKHGTPSHDTLSRVLGMVDPESFHTWFVGWVANKFDVPVGELIALDGKRLASSANRMDQFKKKNQGGKYAKIIVNCFATGAGIILGHKDVSSKMNEVYGAEQLIESLDIKGCCISGDANFCGRKLLELIIGQDADYLIALKGSHPKLHDSAKQAFNDELISKHLYQTKETGHGREETRIYRSISVNELPHDITVSYPNLSQLIEVRRERRVVRKTDESSIEHHYYITSLDGAIEALSQKIRAHWRIENNLHHVLDVGFGEDGSRARNKNLASNLSLIRKASINYLMPGLKKTGIKHKRMRAAFSDQRRSEVFAI
jgi:predicted transposase YbfD/YdcC